MASMLRFQLSRSYRHRAPRPCVSQASMMAVYRRYWLVSFLYAGLILILDFDGRFTIEFRFALSAIGRGRISPIGEAADAAASALC